MPIAVLKYTPVDIEGVEALRLPEYGEPWSDVDAYVFKKFLEEVDWKTASDGFWIGGDFALPGEFIIKNGKGEVSILSDEDFNKAYVLGDNPFVPPGTFLTIEQLYDRWIKDVGDAAVINRRVFPTSRKDLIEYYTKQAMEEDNG